LVPELQLSFCHNQADSIRKLKKSLLTPYIDIARIDVVGIGSFEQFNSSIVISQDICVSVQLLMLWQEEETLLGML